MASNTYGEEERAGIVGVSAVGSVGSHDCGVCEVGGRFERIKEKSIEGINVRR